MNSGIYKIVLPSGGTYVGMTTGSFPVRWKNHLKELRSGRHKCLGLSRAYAKYGESALEFIVVEIIDRSMPDQIFLSSELKWWKSLSADGVKLYNAEPSGTGSVRHSEETRRRIGLNQPNRKPRTFCLCCGKVNATPRQKYCSQKCAATRIAPNDRLHKIDLKEVLRLRDSGYTLHELKDHYGISLGSSHKLLKRANETLLNNTGSNPVGSRKTILRTKG